MTTPPVFEELLNFRDFGGYRAGSRRIVTGRLYRSAAPSRLTEADLATLATLGVDTFVDLRRWSERVAAPSRRPDHFSGSVVEILEKDVMEAPHERYLNGDVLSVEMLRERVLGFYREAPFEPRHLDIFKRGIEAVAAADGAVLIHCAVGKDRTGLLVSLIHHILGVSEEDQMTDYLLTRRDRRLIDELNERSVAAAAQRGKSLTLEAAEALTSVYPENLEIAWETMRERHGSIDGYLGALGIGAATIAAIRSAYLA